MYKVDDNIKQQTSNGVKIRIVILAAGKGTRMKSDTPKVLLPFRGKPMIVTLLDAVERSNVTAMPPVVVVGHGAEAVRATLGSAYHYVVQDPQRGTGHAVAITQDAIRGTADAILVLYADHPLLRGETIRNIADTHRASGAVITMATTTVSHFDKPYDAFSQFGRIIRDMSGAVQKIVEVVDASPEELLVREVNPAMYCFNAQWLWSHLPLLKENGKKKEIFLTDLIELAVHEGSSIATVSIDDPRELIGVNTMEDLHDAERL